MTTSLNFLIAFLIGGVAARVWRWWSIRSGVRWWRVSVVAAMAALLNALVLATHDSDLEDLAFVLVVAFLFFALVLGWLTLRAKRFPSRPRSCGQ
jgi:peptidoglycan/LPS O-acetylase OafA/YrhL